MSSEYINRTSNVFGSCTRFEATEDFSHALVGGEYFVGNLVRDDWAASLRNPEYSN
ncbi:MAG TPA: hypothetical protein VKZ91_10745 [Woeseiaceae bacterium]|nr:hypothetical protein [Woeseiaceae bacterium]